MRRLIVFSLLFSVLLPVISLRVAAQAPKPLTSLTSGSYQVEVPPFFSTWRFNVNGADITGISEWTCCPGPRQDSLYGHILNNSVTITRDCSGQGWPGYCSQTYVGKIKGDQIRGTWSGTGGGGKWRMQLRK